MDFCTPNALPPLSPPLPGNATAATLPGSDRRMVQSALGGKHSHVTADGINVHIWQRKGKYLARGRFGGEPFGQALGEAPAQAEAALRQLLVSIENGTFQRPSEARKNAVRTRKAPALTLRELVSRFITEKRKRLGQDSAADYLARLAPLIEFVESGKNLRRWSTAQAINRDFAMEFQAALQVRQVTRNGHPLAEPRSLSRTQIRNILACTGTMLNWAKHLGVGLLPTTFVNPFDRELVGPRQRRDPLARITAPWPLRLELVPVLDARSLSYVALSMVLPNRPEEFAGLLVSNVDRVDRELVIGDRFGGDDHTKAGTSFRVPYPTQFDALIVSLIAGRADGPLLRRANVSAGKRQPRTVATTTDQITAAYNAALLAAGTEHLKSPGDRKRIFRRLMRDLGGISTDSMATAFRSALAHVRPEIKVRFYDLRGAISTEMKNAGVDYMVRRYVTGHAVGADIMETYEAQDALKQHVNKYFVMIEPLLTAIARRAAELGVG